MKRQIQLLFLGALSLTSSAFSQVSSSKWQAQPIVIDGDGSDWVTIPRFFNAESNMKYEFRNDADNLYIILNAADMNTQMQLSSAGFSVKLKIKTSPPSKFSVNFQAPQMGMMPPPQMDEEKLVEKTITNRKLIQKDTVLIEGFMFTKGKISSEANTEKGISFARSKSTHDLGTYEIRVPLREMFGNEFNLETVSKTPIQLQVNINELSQKGMKKMGGKMNGGMHGGGRGMGGGMSGGGMGGGMPGGGEMGGGPGGGMPGAGGDTEERPQMQAQGMGNMASFERKSFSIDFQLSVGKQ